MTVHDLLELLCKKMGEESRIGEYGLYIRTHTNTHGALLKSEDYIFDICSILDEKRVQYSLLFKKLLWFEDVPFEDQTYNQLIFNQVWNDFVGGYFAAMGATDMYATQDVPRLICLGFIATYDAPSLDTLLERLHEYVPSSLNMLYNDDEWHDKLSNVFHTLSMDAADARRDFLMTLSRHPLYGSRFFMLPKVFDSRIGDGAVLAVNKNGIFFLDANSKQQRLKYSFKEIVSMRRLGSQSKGKHFIDLKLGNLMVQRVTRCETSQSTEIIGIISWYIHASVGPGK